MLRDKRYTLSVFYTVIVSPLVSRGDANSQLDSPNFLSAPNLKNDEGIMDTISTAQDSEPPSLSPRQRATPTANRPPIVDSSSNWLPKGRK
jgi:hypothetical protein